MSAHSAQETRQPLAAIQQNGESPRTKAREDRTKTLTAALRTFEIPAALNKKSLGQLAQLLNRDIDEKRDLLSQLTAHLLDRSPQRPGSDSGNSSAGRSTESPVLSEKENISPQGADGKKKQVLVPETPKSNIRRRRLFRPLPKDKRVVPETPPFRAQEQSQIASPFSPSYRAEQSPHSSPLISPEARGTSEDFGTESLTSQGSGSITASDGMNVSISTEMLNLLTPGAFQSPQHLSAEEEAEIQLLLRMEEEFNEELRHAKEAFEEQQAAEHLAELDRDALDTERLVAEARDDLQVDDREIEAETEIRAEEERLRNESELAKYEAETEAILNHHLGSTGAEDREIEAAIQSEEELRAEETRLRDEAALAEHEEDLLRAQTDADAHIQDLLETQRCFSQAIRDAEEFEQSLIEERDQAALELYMAEKKRMKAQTDAQIAAYKASQEADENAYKNAERLEEEIAMEVEARYDEAALLEYEETERKAQAEAEAALEHYQASEESASQAIDYTEQLRDDLQKERDAADLAIYEAEERRIENEIKARVDEFKRSQAEETIDFEAIEEFEAEIRAHQEAKVAEDKLTEDYLEGLAKEKAEADAQIAEYLEEKEDSEFEAKLCRQLSDIKEKIAARRAQRREQFRDTQARRETLANRRSTQERASNATFDQSEMKELDNGKRKLGGAEQ